MSTIKHNYNFATWLRVFGMIMILLCHFTVHSKYSYISMSAQFFNIGVEIFFILSGFLFGTSGKIYSVKAWYKKRIKRIFIPYFIFVALLAIVHLCYGMNILTLDWLLLLFGVQGSAVGVLGAEQTWFISALLICYLMTPILSKFIEALSKLQLKLFIIVIIFLPLLWAFIPPASFYTLLSPLSWYSIALTLGGNYYKFKHSLKTTFFAFVVMSFSFGVRIVARKFFDGTIIYDRITVRYTQAIAAFCILLIFICVFEKIKPLNVVKFISDISFEVYLYHYMFCVGPIALFGITPFWITDCFLVSVVTLFIAFLTNKISSLVLKRIKT